MVWGWHVCALDRRIKRILIVCVELATEEWQAPTRQEFWGCSVAAATNFYLIVDSDKWPCRHRILCNVFLMDWSHALDVIAVVG